MFILFSLCGCSKKNQLVFTARSKANKKPKEKKQVKKVIRPNARSTLSTQTELSRGEPRPPSIQPLGEGGGRYHLMVENLPLQYKALRTTKTLCKQSLHPGIYIRIDICIKTVTLQYIEFQ